MIWYKLSFIFGFLITTGIGVAVFINHPRRRLNQYWMLVCLSVALWNFGRFMRILSADSQNYSAGLFWCRVMYIGAILIPLFSYLFILKLLNRKPRPGRLVYLPTIFFLFMNFTPLIIKDIVVQFSRLYYPDPGKLYPLFLVYFLTYVIIAHFHLYQSYKTSTGRVKSQIQYVGCASIIGFLSGLTTFPLVFNIQFPPIGAPLVSFYTLIIAYAIVKYRLMDIQIIIKKTVTYALLVFLIILPCYSLIMYGINHYLGVEKPGIWFSLLVFSILLFLSFFTPRVQAKTEKTIEQSMFARRYDYLHALRQSSQDMVSILQLDELLDRLLATLHETFEITGSSILLHDQQNKTYKITSSRNLENRKVVNKHFSENETLFQWLKRKKELIILEELEHRSKHSEYAEIIRLLDLLESKICVPLFFQKRLIGLINLGNKQNGEMFTNEDLKTLATVANHAAVAIENAQLYKKMLRTDRLAAVGTLSARLAHEIRNPLVSIKTVTELLPERIDDPEFRNHFLGVAIKEIQRIKNLVDDLLNFARPSTPKFRYENINILIQDMVHLIDAETRSKGISISQNLGADIPEILIDRDQIKQVILNILLNAVQACKSDGLISIVTRLVNTTNAKQFVQVEINDNGIGIPEKDIENLFNPFFTTKYEGVGLGLSIAHQIVQEHDGYIDINSKKDEGSSFYINLVANGDSRKTVPQTTKALVK